MNIKNNKIISATEIELYEYWLLRYDDIMSFSDFKETMLELGVKIIT